MEETKKKKRKGGKKMRTKSEEKPYIVEYSFSQNYADNANKIKHPANITGIRKKIEKITLAGSLRKSKRTKTLGETD